MIKFTNQYIDKEKKNFFKEKKIKKKMELDYKALRDPRTPREYKIRNDLERVSNNLKRRYNRHD